MIWRCGSAAAFRVDGHGFWGGFLLARRLAPGGGSRRQDGSCRGSQGVGHCGEHRADGCCDQYVRLSDGLARVAGARLGRLLPGGRARRRSGAAGLARLGRAAVPRRGARATVSRICICASRSRPRRVPGRLPAHHRARAPAHRPYHSCILAPATDHGARPGHSHDLAARKDLVRTAPPPQPSPPGVRLAQALEHGEPSDSGVLGPTIVCLCTRECAQRVPARTSV